ncbi:MULTISPECIES: carbon storage regulator [Stenotrophomonas]|uniref:carbon storage regulator n=1 Tax=Stenotrophomonas TaxID=40323 RepID=UPI0021C695DA|nr:MULTISPECIES: carbon storage regulator [Stenotrophomonas]MCU1136987.1 carbon storage regulator [Stenotrophomonas maltophilia]
MLVLMRREGEAIHAGTAEEIKAGAGIVFRVLSNEKGQIKIGIDAPQDIVLVREELISRGMPGGSQ